MKGYRYSTPTVGIARNAPVLPVGRKWPTPGWLEIEASMGSARTIANGVQISPAGSVNERRHCASAESRVWVPGMPPNRQFAGVRAAGSTEIVVHRLRPSEPVLPLIILNAAVSRDRLVKLVL